MDLFLSLRGQFTRLNYNEKETLESAKISFFSYHTTTNIKTTVDISLVLDPYLSYLFATRVTWCQSRAKDRHGHKQFNPRKSECAFDWKDRRVACVTLSSTFNNIVYIHFHELFCNSVSSDCYRLGYSLLIGYEEEQILQDCTLLLTQTEKVWWWRDRQSDSCSFIIIMKVKSLVLCLLLRLPMVKSKSTGIVVLWEC